MTYTEGVLLALKTSDWFLSRPKKVQAAILKHPPGKYRMKSTGNIVRLYSYDEDLDGKCNECTVNVLFEDNTHIAFERSVFGVSLEDLEELED